MKKFTLLFLFVLSTFLFTNCRKTTIFEETVTFPNANWAFENKEVNFEVPITGSNKPHAVVLELDLVGTPNVDMFNASITIITPNGGKTSIPVVFNFINPREPYIQGKNSSEKIIRLIAYPKKYFSETGIYKIEINQFSNKADNYGIRSLRLYIEKVKEK
jgi:hypothetical protein